MAQPHGHAFEPVLKRPMLQAGLLWSYDGSEQLHCSSCKFEGQLSGAAPGVQKLVQLIDTTITCKRLVGWDGFVVSLNQTAEVGQQPSSAAHTPPPVHHA